MGYSYGYYCKTEKDALAKIEEMKEQYALKGMGPPEIYLEKADKEWLVRDFGVRRERKEEKKWWQFWRR